MTKKKSKSPAKLQEDAELAIEETEAPDSIEIDVEHADLLRYEDEVGKLQYVQGSERIVDQRRWSVLKDRIFKHIGNGAYYRFRWDDPATESQELDLENDGSTTLHRVYPSDVTVTVYLTKDEQA